MPGSKLKQRAAIRVCLRSPNRPTEKKRERERERGYRLKNGPIHRGADRSARSTRIPFPRGGYIAPLLLFIPRDQPSANLRHATPATTLDGILYFSQRFFRTGFGSAGLSVPWINIILVEYSIRWRTPPIYLGQTDDAEPPAYFHLVT